MRTDKEDVLMFEKKFLGVITALCVVLSASGCGEAFPELSDEEYNHTVEYAAGLLMRYSNNGQERLIYVDAKELEKQREKEAKELGEEAAPVKEKEPVKAPEPATPTEPVNSPETVDTPEEPATTESEEAAQQEPSDNALQETADNTQTTESDESENTEGSSKDGNAGLSNAVTLSSDESQEIMDDIFLSYQGYSVSSTYPESSKSYVVNADKGKKLLVLRFDLYNGTDSTKDVNMIPLNMMFQVVLNGKNLGYSSVTFLPNDLSSYVGKIDSRAHESVVVLSQISADDATSIQSLGMVATIKGVTQNVILK